MKLNWGKAIIVTFVIFISFIIYIVSGSINAKIDLVTIDYYGKELLYQDDINKQKNARKLSSPISLKMSQHTLSILLPDEFNGKLCTGKVVFYRASDALLDKEFSVYTENGLILLPNKFLSIGKWLIILDISSNGNEYQIKKDLFI
jgi:hypothetical protein